MSGSAVMDASGWKKFVGLLLSNPELILGLLVIVGAVFWFAWWLRGHTGKESIAALNTRIATLQDANNQHVEALNAQIADLQARLRDTREDLHKAEAKQDRLTTQLEKLTTVSTELSTAAKQFQETRASQPKPEPPMKWIDANEAMRARAQEAYLDIVVRGSSGLAKSVGSLSQANSELRETLSTISAKLEVTEEPDKANIVVEHNKK